MSERTPIRPGTLPALLTATLTALTILALALVITLLAAPLAAQDARAAAEQGIQRLMDATGGTAAVRVDAATGTASFVRLPEDPIKALAGVATPGTARDKAAAFFSEHGGVFGVTDAAAELELVGVREGAAMTHVTYRQLYAGVPVFAAVLRAHFDRSGALAAVNGHFVPDLALDTTPRWSAEQAGAVALRAVASEREGRPRLSVAGNELNVLRRGLVQGVPGPSHLVWKVEVRNAGGTVREFVFVDAHTGKVVEQITGVHEALDRRVSESSLGNVVWVEGDPDPIPGGWAGGSGQQVTDWQNEIDGARETYNVFGSMTNGAYLSYDGAMAVMRTVNNDPTISCPNANWNGTSTNYCSGVTGDDTVAHEWGHAYTEYTNNLIYQWQSGALNESYSDIWGEVVDLVNGRGLDAPGGLRSAGGCSLFGTGSPSVDNSYRWLSGEDDPAFGGAIRDMWRPNCYGDPGKVTDTGQYVCSTADAGGVHTNSGVPNHGFALMVDGGTFNGQTVTGIGLTKAARIHWEAQNLLTPASDFSDHADALETACAALVGATLYELDAQSPNGVVSGQVVTAGDCAQVAAANAAVEFRTEPTFCNFTPLLDPDAPALCGGSGVSSIYYQGWESGLGAWTVGTRAVVNPATFDTADWAVVGNLPGSRAGAAAFVADDQSLGDCVTDVEAGVLFLDSPVIAIPAGATSPGVAFDHWVATEAGWDGGNLKVSVNGGAFTLIPASAYTFNAYNSSLVTSQQGAASDNPLAGQAAFTGTDGGSAGGTWGQSQISLGGIAGPGDTVRVRFEMGLDGCFGVLGWYVDDFEVYACSCGNGVCESGEDCDSCPSDCPTFGGGGCGNGVCEVGDGEDCVTCPADCNGVQGGKPANRFCCGNGGQSPVGCADARCTTGGFACTTIPSGSASCCGDFLCEGQETANNCTVDCCLANEPGFELSCGDGADNDCDGLADCADSDCSGAPACQSSCGNGVCESGEDCQSCSSDCAGKTGGPPSGRYCCGDGVQQSPETSALCDGNF